MLVHLLQAKVLDVDEARPELVPYLGAEHFRVAERGFYGEVFLKRDLALHDVPPAVLLARASCNDAARAVSNGGNKKAARRRLFIFTYWKPSWGLPGVACEASEGWWSQAGSNRRPPACHAGALPAELWPLTFVSGSTNRFSRGMQRQFWVGCQTSNAPRGTGSRRIFFFFFFSCLFCCCC